MSTRRERNTLPPAPPPLQSGSRIKISLGSLLQIASGVFISGCVALYAMHRHQQNRVRNSAHYAEAFRIVSKHKQLLSVLGEPILLGRVSLTDRQHNYIGEFDSRFRVPVTGPLDAGYLDMLAVRDKVEDQFRCKRLQYESEAAGTFVVYES